MTHSHLFMLLQDSGLSPEALGQRIGISGMSIRRWLKGEKSSLIPEPYASAFQMSVQRLLIEGVLNPTSPSVAWAFGEIGSLPQNASLGALGLESGKDGDILSALNRLGEKSSNEEEVHSSLERIENQKKSGTQWAEKINVLVRVLKSKTLVRFEKSVAIGALFYLVFAFDLIPDGVPLFGLLDDYAILGLAATYYTDRKN